MDDNVITTGTVYTTSAANTNWAYGTDEYIHFTTTYQSSFFTCNCRKAELFLNLKL
jgi:hypothetical protein